MPEQIEGQPTIDDVFDDLDAYENADPADRAAAAIKLLGDSLFITKIDIGAVQPALLPGIDALLAALASLGPIVIQPAPGN
jgi:hypothetical protein